MVRSLTGPKIKRGQVWRRRMDKNPPPECHDVLIVQGGEYPKGKRVDKPHIQHHFKKRSLWLYYELIGTEKNHPPMPLQGPAR